LAIARRCRELTLVLGKPQLPDFPTPLANGAPMPMADYFRVASHQGLEERLAQLYRGAVERERERPRYVEAARVRDQHDPEDGLSPATS